MKYFFVIIFLLSIYGLKAQERNQVQGLVTKKDTVMSNVHVRNISTGKFSVSGASGEFYLNTKAGDTLVFSHVGMQDLIIFTREEDLKQDPVIFRMTESSTELKEVLVRETSEINAVSLGIIPKKIEKLSVNERRLRQAGDFKPRHLLGILGGGVSIDAILNAINGRTKKLKRNISYEIKEKHITYLELNFAGYMQKEMALSEHEMRLLINYAIEDEQLQQLISLGNEARLQFFLQETWINIEEDINSD